MITRDVVIILVSSALIVVTCVLTYSLEGREMKYDKHRHTNDPIVCHNQFTCGWSII